MQLGVTALHSKGVRPEKGIKSPHETRPRAYVLVRLPEGHCWWDALAISADAEPHQKENILYLNTENNLVQFTVLIFFFRNLKNGALQTRAECGFSHFAAGPHFAEFLEGEMQNPAGCEGTISTSS